MARLLEPGLALVADIEAVSDEVLAAFDLWAGQAWQPLCVVSLEAAPDAARFVSHLRDRAFDRIVPVQGGFVGPLRSALRDVLASDAWIAVHAAQALECNDPVVVRALAMGLDLLPQHHTVTRWARVLGCARRQDLEAMFASRGLSPPKAVLDRLRLARLIHWAGTTRPTPTRDELAARFGYSSGDYLGKRAKVLTGAALGRLVREGAVAIF